MIMTIWYYQDNDDKINIIVRMKLTMMISDWDIKGPMLMVIIVWDYNNYNVYINDPDDEDDVYNDECVI